MSMTIDRIGLIDPIQSGKRPAGPERVNKSRGADSISISSQAQERAELLKAQQIAAAAPEVRAERIAELKDKINDPSYINDRVLNATAERIIDSIFG
ncbi:MAG: flagellar biosynthesis anti-sigma factor FlgM [Treponema sp.]|nr:flagellar biosynthesis anti-sigma factor FlgM [Treponema sp.]